MTKQYTKLSQSGKDFDSTNYMVKPGGNLNTTKRSCCFSTFVAFALFVMLCGGLAIVLGVFYTPQLNTLIDNYWQHSGSNVTNTNQTLLTQDAVLVQQDVNKTAESTAIEHPMTILPDTSTITYESTTNSITTVSSQTPYTTMKNEDKDEDLPETSTSQPLTTQQPRRNEEKEHTTVPNSNEVLTEDKKIERIDVAKEQFASWMMSLKQLLGIKRPELVVPLFMLFCFFVSLALACCCCCFMMKRRELQRRRHLGKIITDLQTGDSGSVLLNDGDD